MIFNALSDAEIREYCRETIEALELWLRRLIDNEFTQIYGSDYINYQDQNGNYLIQRRVRENIADRLKKESKRYLRAIDAILLEDIIDIVCHQKNFNNHFRDALNLAFPLGNNHARTYLKIINTARNPLSHANLISKRQAEQVVCYAHDILDSLKDFYTRKNLHMDYNVPLIIRFKDSFGNDYHRNQFFNWTNACGLKFHNKKEFYLWPGDELTIELEVDPSFNESEYSLNWNPSNAGYILSNHDRTAYLKIENRHVNAEFSINVYVISNKDWHKHGHYDDRFSVRYKICQPAG